MNIFNINVLAIWILTTWTFKVDGMVQCVKACPLCLFIKRGKTVKINIKNATWKLNRKFSCQNYNILYVKSCDKERCQENRYIGETRRSLKTHLADHGCYVRNQQATRAHFNQPGHSLANMNIAIWEQVERNDVAYRKEIEPLCLSAGTSQQAVEKSDLPVQQACSQAAHVWGQYCLY